MSTRTMRAISQDTLGGPEVLKEVELPVPKPGPSQILVRVRAAGVNPTDWKHRAMRIFLPDPPYVLGWDVSGVVESVGLGVTLFKPGDDVFGMLPYPHGVGSHAEYVTGPTRAFARKPAGVGHVQAASIPVVGLTAYQILVDAVNLQAGQRVLIHGAAGGVGHVAVQIAKARGAQVIGTASAAKHAFLRDIGADETIDYHTADLHDLSGGLDVVLDAVGGYGSRSLPLLREGGTFITIARPTDGELRDEAARRGIRTELLLVEADHAGMTALSGLMTRGQLRPHIAATFPLADAARAHELGETNRTAGKLVLTMD